MTILKSKNIVFITPKESEFLKGGIASWTTKLLQNGLPQGYSFKVIDSSVILKRGIFNSTKYNIFVELIRTFLIIIKLVYQIIILRPKILHINSSISQYGVSRDLMCLLFAKFFGLEAFVHFRGNLPQTWQSKRSFSNKILDQLIKISDGVIAINRPSISFLEVRTRKEKIHKLESFIEEDAFNGEKIYSQKSSGLQILFVGAFIEEKGAEEILALSEAFPELIFNLAGQISRKFEKDISIKSNLIERGIVSRKKIFDLLDKNDIFLFPSHSEGFPNVVLEAMSRGLPVVASNVGAIPEMIIERKGGYLCDVRDIDSYINSLEKLMKNPVDRENMGNYNYRRAKELFNYDIVIKKMLKIYQT